MLSVWVTVGLALLMASGTMIGFLPVFRKASSSWRFLSASAIPFGLMGTLFIFRFWEPTTGPYRVAELYPYGSPLQAWQVSFSFAWLAFSMLFLGFALLASHRPNKVAWATLLASWLVFLIPHLFIGLAFAWAGQNEPNIEEYRTRASDVAGLMLIVTMAVLVLSHLSFSIGGFIWTGRELWRKDVKYSS